MILVAIGCLTVGFLIGMIFECNRWVRMASSGKIREVGGDLYVAKTFNPVTVTNITEDIAGGTVDED